MTDLVREYITVFLVGMATSIITLSYIFLFYEKAGHPKQVPILTITLLVMTMFGVFAMLDHYIVDKTESYYSSLLVGALAGLIFSLFGRFMFNLPILIFNFKPENAYEVHYKAPLIYAIIFFLIKTPIINYVLNK